MASIRALLVMLVFTRPIFSGPISDYISIGNCRLTVNAELANDLRLWPVVCLKGDLTGQIRYLSPSKDNFEGYGLQIRGYGGIHLTEHLSAHVQGVNIKPPGFQSKALVLSQRITELAFLQIGNSYLDKNDLSVGKINLPFGLNHDIFNAEFRQFKRDFWIQRVWGLRLSQRNNNNTRYEVGVSYRKQGTNRQTLQKRRVDWHSFRASLDLSALDGTKLIASAARTDDKNYKMGMAILNRSQGSQTSIEWIRSSPNQEGLDFFQLFRISHMTKWQGRLQSLVEYEHDRRYQWLFSKQFRYLYRPKTAINLTLSYRRQIISPRSDNWIFTISNTIRL